MEEEKRDKPNNEEKFSNENFVKVSLRCPFCLLKGKTPEIIDYVHGNCGGELEISNLANIKCKKCGKCVLVSDAIFTDCDEEVYFKDQKEFEEREVKIKPKDSDHEYGHNIFIAVGGQLTAAFGRTWLLEFLRNLNNLPKTEKGSDDEEI